MVDDSEPLPNNGAIRDYDPLFVEVDGYRTRYFDIGDGSPIVLLHGGNWGGFNNANTWSTVFDHLSQQFRVIAFDRLGCGMTDSPTDLNAYRYRTEVDHALAFLDTLGIDRCHLCGTSRGGGLATAMAVESDEQFETLVVLNSGTLGPPTGDKDSRRRRVFDHVDESYDPTDPAYMRAKHRQYCHRTAHITEEFCDVMAAFQTQEAIHETKENMERGGKEQYVESMDEAMNQVRRQILDGALTIPTLYTFGRDDLTVPLQMGLSAFELMSQENPSTRMTIFNRCGHLIHREHPEEFSQTVIDFIRRWN